MTDFNLQITHKSYCDIGGYSPKGGAKMVVVRERGTNVYIKQGFEIDNNLNKYRRYLAFLDLRTIK